MKHTQGTGSYPEAIYLRESKKPLLHDDVWWEERDAQRKDNKITYNENYNKTIVVLILFVIIIFTLFLLC